MVPQRTSPTDALTAASAPIPNTAQISSSSGATSAGRAAGSQIARCDARRQQAPTQERSSGGAGHVARRLPRSPASTRARTGRARLLRLSRPLGPRCCNATRSAVVPWAAGRLHSPDDAQVEPREVNVGRRAIASVEHLATGSPHEPSSGGLLLLCQDAVARDREPVLAPPPNAERGSDDRSARKQQSAASVPGVALRKRARPRLRRPAAADAIVRLAPIGDDPRDSDVANSIVSSPAW